MELWKRGSAWKHGRRLFCFYLYFWEVSLFRSVGTGGVEVRYCVMHSLLFTILGDGFVRGCDRLLFTMLIRGTDEFNVRDAVYTCPLAP